MNKAKFTNGISYHYGFADFTFNMMMTIATTYYAIFLTDVALIVPAAVGVLLLIARIGDGISAVITGAIIQRSQLRWGKFRSWLLFSPPVTAVFFVLMFTNFNLSSQAKAILMCASYIIAYTFVNFSYNAHISLMGVIGKTPEERITLSNRKSQFLCLGSVVFGLVFIPVLTGVGGSYTLAVAIFAALHVLGYWNIFRISKAFELVDSNMDLESAPAAPKLSLEDMVSSIFKNKQLVLIMVVDVLKWLGFMSFLGSIAYYFTYVAGNPALVGTYFLWHGIATFVGSIIAVKVIQWIGKKNTVILALFTFSIMFLIMKFFAGSNPTLFIVFACIAVLGFQFTQNVEPAMYMDCAEYGFNKTGKDSAAFIMSMFAMPIKIGVALSGAAIGWGLAAINYSPTVEVTADFAANLTSLVVLLPAVCLLAAAVLMFGYKLNDAKVQKIMEENTAKREASASNAS